MLALTAEQHRLLLKLIEREAKAEAAEAAEARCIAQEKKAEMERHEKLRMAYRSFPEEKETGKGWYGIPISRLKACGYRRVTLLLCQVSWRSWSNYLVLVGGETNTICRCRNGAQSLSTSNAYYPK